MIRLHLTPCELNDPAALRAAVAFVFTEPYYLTIDPEGHGYRVLCSENVLEWLLDHTTPILEAAVHLPADHWLIKYKEKLEKAKTLGSSTLSQGV